MPSVSLFAQTRLPHETQDFFQCVMGGRARRTVEAAPARKAADWAVFVACEQALAFPGQILASGMANGGFRQRIVKLKKCSGLCTQARRINDLEVFVRNLSANIVGVYIANIT